MDCVGRNVLPWPVAAGLTLVVCRRRAWSDEERTKRRACRENQILSS